MTLFSIILCGLMVMAFYLGYYRNNRVFEFRSELIETVFNNNLRDLEALRHASGLNVGMVDQLQSICNARWDDLHTVGYNKMVLQFWKPLTPESFYDDTSFLR